MRFVLVCYVALFTSAALCQAKKAQEWTLNLAQYGLVKTGCARYPGKVEFLDDDHLVISAPFEHNCKTYSDQPLDTQITEIDLQGNKLVATRRADVVSLMAGPIGFVALCTGDRVELLSNQLQAEHIFAVSGKWPTGGCSFGPRLSPSRTSVAVEDSANAKFHLYQGSTGNEIAEMSISRGRSIRALAEDGFLVCFDEENICDVVSSSGEVRHFRVPSLLGADGYYIVGLVAPDKLLMGGFGGKRLYAETSSGTTVSMGDVGTIKPPFIDSSHAQISAAEPRRILYQVDGCLLGDFDDCYGVVFHRFAVFDSQTSKMLFRHTYHADADLKISPNGKLVMERDGAQVHIFRLP